MALISNTLQTTAEHTEPTTAPMQLSSLITRCGGVQSSGVQAALCRKATMSMRDAGSRASCAGPDNSLIIWLKKESLVNCALNQFSGELDIVPYHTTVIVQKLVIPQFPISEITSLRY